MERLEKTIHRYDDFIKEKNSEIKKKEMIQLLSNQLPTYQEKMKFFTHCGRNQN